MVKSRPRGLRFRRRPEEVASSSFEAPPPLLAAVVVAVAVAAVAAVTRPTATTTAMMTRMLDRNNRSTMIRSSMAGNFISYRLALFVVAASFLSSFFFLSLDVFSDDIISSLLFDYHTVHLLLLLLLFLVSVEASESCEIAANVKVHMEQQ